jgi:soluble lytic murein transglycosylase
MKVLHIVAPRSYRRVVFGMGLAVCLAWTPSAPAQTPAPGSRAEQALQDASAAFRKGDRARVDAALSAVAGHPLQAWVEYWSLSLRLHEVPASDIRAFLQRNAGTYVEDRLRNDWLLQLGRQRDWTNFRAEHAAYRMRDDTEVKCYALLADRLADKSALAATTAAADEVRRLWHAQREADDGCALAAQELHTAGRLPALEVWKKARLAVDSNRPRAARVAIGLVAPEAVAAFDEVFKQPERWLKGRVTAPGRARKELVLLALIRWGASDLGAAQTALDQKWSVHLTAEERNWAWGALGRQAAQKLQPDALETFANVARPADLSDDMLGWWTRAALRAGKGPQWSTVLKTTEALSDLAKTDSTWAYWRARALLALAATERTDTAQRHRAEAEQMLQRIAGPFGFYEQLALEQLGKPIVLPPPPPPLSDSERQQARQNAGLQRALLAIRSGLRSEGVREWNYHTNLVNADGQAGGMPTRELLAAAQLACDAGVWDRCINTSDRTRGEFDVAQRYPMPFRDSVVRRSQDIALDPAYVYGLIRQESRFVMDARSVVGASGLMQVMPATAKWTARKIGMAGFTPDQISDRDTNIAIGTGYLKLVLDDFQGSLPLAAAAYNAGPSRSRNWRAPGGTGPDLEGAIWAENVPFAETRDYVKKVLANTTVYAAVLTRQPQSLRERLGTVGPRRGSAPEESRDLP